MTLVFNEFNGAQTYLRKQLWHTLPLTIRRFFVDKKICAPCILNASGPLVHDTTAQ